MEYTLVEAGTAADLQQSVTSRLADGWVPVGGVAVCYFGNGGWYFCQAMVLMPDDAEE